MTTLNGKYVLERRLGGGGMAEVFLARTVGAAGFSRQVAIKRVLPGYTDNAAFTEMFVSEAMLSSRLQHQNVVAVADFDHDQDGGLFLVMELVDGVDLDALQRTGFLPVPVVLFVIAEALRGLGYAHDLPVSHDSVRGLVHRDVSPHNVLLSWDGAVKVSDFGIAKARDASAATASLMLKGKPAYMSPEQANCQRLDGRSDLFAVGVVLWELLCGRPLLAGDSVQSTLARVLFAPLPSPRELRPDVPADVERITMRLLERNPENRYAKADHAVADLLACADYPRDGRDLLIRVLAERFVGRAPPRQELVRTAGPQDATRAPTAHTPVVSTRDLPSASDGGMYGHATRTAVPVPRRRVLPPLLALGAMVGVVAVAAVLYLQRDTSGSVRRTDAAGVTLDASPAPPSPTQPAPELPVVTELGSPPDAAPAAATEPSAAPPATEVTAKRRKRSQGAPRPKAQPSIHEYSGIGRSQEPAGGSARQSR